MFVRGREREIEREKERERERENLENEMGGRLKKKMFQYRNLTRGLILK